MGCDLYSNFVFRTSAEIFGSVEVSPSMENLAKKRNALRKNRGICLDVSRLAICRNISELRARKSPSGTLRGRIIVSAKYAYGYKHRKQPGPDLNLCLNIEQRFFICGWWAWDFSTYSDGQALVDLRPKAQKIPIYRLLPPAILSRALIRVL